VDRAAFVAVGAGILRFWATEVGRGGENGLDTFLGCGINLGGRVVPRHVKYRCAGWLRCYPLASRASTLRFLRAAY